MLDYPGRCSGKRSEQAATTGWAASRGLAVAECWTMSARTSEDPRAHRFASSVSGASEQDPLCMAHSGGRRWRTARAGCGAGWPSTRERGRASPRRQEGVTLEATERRRRERRDACPRKAARSLARWTRTTTSSGRRAVLEQHAAPGDLREGRRTRERPGVGRVLPPSAGHQPQGCGARQGPTRPQPFVTNELACVNRPHHGRDDSPAWRRRRGARPRS
jgi:hypothetical protein